MNVSREAFEAYVIQDHHCSPDDLKWDESRNCYAMWVMHFAYQAWEAREALSHASATAEECSVDGEAVAYGVLFDWKGTGKSEVRDLYRDRALAEGKATLELSKLLPGIPITITCAPLFRHPMRVSDDMVLAASNKFGHLRKKGVSQLEAIRQAIDQAIAAKRGEK